MIAVVLVVVGYVGFGSDEQAEKPQTAERPQVTEKPEETQAEVPEETQAEVPEAGRLVPPLRIPGFETPLPQPVEPAAKTSSTLAGSCGLESVFGERPKPKPAPRARERRREPDATGHRPPPADAIRAAFFGYGGRDLAEPGVWRHRSSDA